MSDASSRWLADRETGQFPVSIGTSLAIEAGFGIHPDIKDAKGVPLTEYHEVWINLRTLFRNMIGAMPSEHGQMVLAPAVAEALRHEMDQLENIVTEKMSGKVIFYLSNYKGLGQKYPHARIREDTTDKQKMLRKTMSQALAFIVQNEKGTKEVPNTRFKVFDLGLKPDRQVKTLMLTHVAYDLLSAKHFGALTLLESHTGHFKDKAQWYTKYLNGKELLKIPFREDLLQIFGDNEFFHPYPIEQRRELLSVADKYDWSPVTTTEKIRYGIATLKNPYFVSKLRAMLVI